MKRRLKMEKIIRVLNCIFLAGILFVLILIFIRIPPNRGDFAKARNNKALQALHRKVPVMRITGTVDTQVENTVDVEVRNTPLEVEIY